MVGWGLVSRSESVLAGVKRRSTVVREMVLDIGLLMCDFIDDMVRVVVVMRMEPWEWSFERNEKLLT